MDPATRQEYQDRVATSADGTSIGYRQIGTGPGVVLVQGAMGTAHTFDQLARALANDFTVYLPDRRGRGASPRPYSPAHTIDRDVEDVASVLERSGARYIFGLSSGAVIALAAAQALAVIDKAALYEPPVHPDGVSRRSIDRFNKEVERGQLAAALVTIIRMVRAGPPVLQYTPRPLLEFGVKTMIEREARRGSGQYAPLRELIPAMRYDFNVVSGVAAEAASFSSLRKEVLLLGGDRSGDYLRAAVTFLEHALPNAKRVEFAGLGHSGPSNADRGGDPKPVARALKAFFLS